MGKRLFGTDGIRGVAGEAPLDDRTVFAVGQALAAELGAGGGSVLIGMDTRESGPHIANLLAGGLLAGGLNADFAGVLPTAAVSLLTGRSPYRTGVMISASHNPHQDNGIKVFGADGFKLPDAVEQNVEERIFALLAGDLQPAEKTVEVNPRFEERYLKHLLKSGAPAENLRPLKLEVDCSNGAAHRLSAGFFEQLGMNAEVFAAEPDGRNINLDCGSLHLDKLQQKVRESGADLGVAFDGDADRALFVADDGEIVDGDVILLLAGRFLKERARLPGNRVVTTVMANMGLEKALGERGVKMSRTQVGDKYVLEKMVASGATLGGEQSGHIIFKEFANTGDGLLTARVMLEILSAAKKPLSELRKQLPVFPQKLVNVRVKEKPAIADAPALAAAVKASEDQLAGNGRVVVRYSGTEPLARIMIEAASQEDVDRHCEEIEKVFVREIGL